MDLPFVAAPLAGLATGFVALSALRFPALAWVALVPLGYVTATASASEAALAAAVAGALFGVSGQTTSLVRRLLPVSASVLGLSFALCFGLAAHLLPPDELEWAVLAVPLATVAAVLPLRLLGAPRYVTNLLARTQERWRRVVHIGRLGSDLSVLATIALANGACVALTAPSGRLAGGLALLAVAAALALASRSLRRSAASLQSAPTLRIAAVVDDGAAEPFDLDHADRRLEAVVARYAPLVKDAAVRGAVLAVLPEVAVRLDTTSADEWETTVGAWASQHAITVVAPFFDAIDQRNALLVCGPDGQVVGRYDKQHPGPIEPPRIREMPPLTFPVGERTACAVICVDLDYGDLVATAAACDLLVVPANDWPDFDEVHHQTAVWSPVLAGVGMLRATGHGISACIDAAGRMIACAKSDGHPVVLVANLPLRSSTS